VIAPVSFRTKSRKSPASARFDRLIVSEVRAGDKVEVRCTGGKKKGCPFSKKTVTGKAGKRTVDVGKLLKKRYLARGAVLDLRVLRTNEIGRVQRFTVGRKGAVKNELLCMNVGASKPTKCA
jgi:hypothetical protein